MLSYLHPIDADLGCVGAVEQDADVGQGAGDHPQLRRHEHPEAEGHHVRNQVNF